MIIGLEETAETRVGVGVARGRDQEPFDEPAQQPFDQEPGDGGHGADMGMNTGTDGGNGVGAGSLGEPGGAAWPGQNNSDATGWQANGPVPQTWQADGAQNAVPVYQETRNPYVVGAQAPYQQVPDSYPQPQPYVAADAQGNPYVKTVGKRSRGPVFAVIAVIVAVAMIAGGVVFLHSPRGRVALMRMHMTHQPTALDYPYSEQEKIAQLGSKLDSAISDIDTDDSISSKDVQKIEDLLKQIKTEDATFAKRSEMRKPHAKLRLQRYLKASGDEQAQVEEFLGNQKAVTKAVKTCGSFPFDPMDDIQYGKYVKVDASCRAALEPLAASKNQSAQQLATQVGAVVDKGRAGADTLHSMAGQDQGGGISDQESQAMDAADISGEVSDMQYQYARDLRKAREACHADWKLDRLIEALAYDGDPSLPTQYYGDDADDKKAVKALDKLELAHDTLDQDIENMNVTGMGELDADDAADLNTDIADIQQAHDALSKLPVASDAKYRPAWDKYEKSYAKELAIDQDYAANIVQVSTAKGACTTAPEAIGSDERQTGIYADYINTCKAALAPFDGTQNEPLAKMYALSSARMDSMQETLTKMQARVATKKSSERYDMDSRFDRLKRQLDVSIEQDDGDSAFTHFGDSLANQRKKAKLEQSLDDLRRSVNS